MCRILIILAITFLVTSMGALGQEKLSATEKKILLPVRQLFGGMEANDSSLVRQAFTNDAVLYTATPDSTGSTRLQETNLKNFLTVIGSPKKVRFREVISNLKISYEEPLASVWCDYSFYLGGDLHHCGVNHFLLFLTPDGWKIRQVTDTRRTENCPS